MTQHTRLRLCPRSILSRYPVMHVLLSVLFLATLVFSVPSSHLNAQTSDTPVVRNIIFLIGDGMSFQQLESARIVKGGPLTMDGIAIKSQARNASMDNAVTDSAAAATALATGFRTNNGMIGVTPDGKNLDSVLRLAKAAGKRTGVVVTDIVYGATPGSFLANVGSRSSQADILEQEIFQTQPFVLLGGGMSVFNQIRGADRLSQTGYNLVRNRDQLLAWDTNKDTGLLGLFASGTMTYEVDRKASEPHITDMVKVALDILSKDEDGFFLMVEGSRIDHAGHANDLRRSVYEVLAFDQAVAIALEFASKRTDTLVVVTADHETGGLTPGGKPSAQVISKGSAAVATELNSAISKEPDSDVRVLFEKHAGVTDLDTRVIQGSYADLIKSVLDEHSFYYTRTGHSDAPVPIFAQGPNAERLLEAKHIMDIGRLVIDILGVKGGDR